MPSVTSVATDMPVWRNADAAGVGAFLKVMVLPLTFSVEPSAIRLPRVATLVVRVAPTVVMPEPSAVVRPSAFRKSALPLTLRSPPVEVSRLMAPPPTTDGGRLASVGRECRDAGVDYRRANAAGEIDGGLSTSPTVAVEAVIEAPI